MISLLGAPAISLWQPWASLWLIPHAKVHETRHWPAPAKYVGRRILVHAAKMRVPLDDLDDDLVEVCVEQLGETWREEIPYGAFIGSIALISSFRIVDDLLRGAGAAHCTDAVCGNWADGRYAWRGLLPCVFASPIPAKGHQGFWVNDLALRALPA